MNSSLDALYLLHLVDDRIHRACAGLKALDQPPPLAVQLHRITEELARQEAAQLRARAAQQEAELELKTLEARRDADTKKLYGGQIVATRELQALEHEIAHIGGLISAAEEKVLEAMEAVDPIHSAVEKLRGYRKAAEAKLAATQVEREGERRRLQADLAQAEPLRPPAAAHVDPALLHSYDQIRARRGHPGLALVVNATCGQCHTSVPSLVLSRVRKGEIVQCDTCNRLYHLKRSDHAEE